MWDTPFAGGVQLRHDHDDDLESSVREDAEEETDSFPDTAEDFDADDAEAVNEDELPLDEDDAEL